MTDTSFPLLLDTLEERHVQVGHSGSFEGCTSGKCPGLLHEFISAIHDETMEGLEDQIGDLQDQLEEAKADQATLTRIRKLLT